MTDIKCRTRRFRPASAVALSLTFTSAGVAAASTHVQAMAEQAAAEADVEMFLTLDASTRANINEGLEAAHQEALPASAVAFGFNQVGDVVTVNSAGAETVLESAASMDAQIAAAETEASTSIQVGAAGFSAEPATASISAQPATASFSVQPAAASDGDKGVLTGAAATIAGCGGGIIGYDAILEILERRASYWTVVKFVGSKIGPGLAISCIAGAGGALATYMNW